jgi:hypothetical protein
MSRYPNFDAGKFPTSRNAGSRGATNSDDDGDASDDDSNSGPAWCYWQPIRLEAAR